MNAKKKSAKKTTTEPQVDLQFAAKLEAAARSSAEVARLRSQNSLLQQVREARGMLLAACSAPRKSGGGSRLYGSHSDESGVISAALDGRADDAGIDEAALNLAKRWAAFAACLTDLSEADAWRDLDTKRIVSANDYLAAADRQADGTGGTSKSLPPIGGSELVEIAASVFVPLLDACTKGEKPTNEVADEAIETASSALRAIIKSNRSLADWLGRYFDGAEAAIVRGRAAGQASLVAPQQSHPPTANCHTEPVIAPDGSWLRVGKKRFDFKQGLQRQIVLKLFEAWTNGGDNAGLSLAGLQTELDGVSSADRLRIDRTFKGHPALHQILVRVGKGLWALRLHGE